MADEDDEVLVKVEDEPPPAKKGDGDDAVAALKSQYDTLQRKAEEDRSAREAAERRAQDSLREADAARKEAAAARAETSVSQADTVDAGIAAAEAAIANAEAEDVKASEEGNYAAAAKARTKAAMAAADLRRLNEAKEDIEARKIERTEAPQRQSEDPVEAYIAGRTEPTAQWLRAHRDWVVDPRKNAKLTSAHWSAVGEGLAPDSDDYFKHVEGVLGINKDGNGAAPKPQQQRRAPPVAPVAASGGSAMGTGGSNEVRLTKREAEAATDGTHVWNYSDPSGNNKFKKGDPIGVQEFARRKRAMTKDGQYDKSYTE